MSATPADNVQTSLGVELRPQIYNIFLIWARKNIKKMQIVAGF